jgi:CBS domain-containing protein
MVARDIMTKDVIVVGLTTGIRDLAKTLIKHQVSGAPVVNKTGKS